MTVQSSIQPLESGPETSGYPRFESHGGMSDSDDRQIGRYCDSDWFKENPNRTVGMEVSRTGMTCAEYCPYIKVTSLNHWAVSNQPAVEVIVFRSPHRLVRDAHDKDTTWIRLTYFWFHNCQAWWIVMSSSKIMPEADRPGAVDTDSTQPSETFLRHVLRSHSDRLYDLPEDISDVMGLQALRPSAEVCKVMTVPNSHCVSVVTPDEHVSNGFHEILIHDMERENWPLVTLSDIGCLRLDWLKDLFTFVGRYQCELEQMRKHAGNASDIRHSEKYIQVNLGKHVALYHLDLAQLWRCPVPWCTVWKGTSQDCVDHMKKAHDTPVFVKVGNLARWFPPWTVTREQWHSMSRPSVSGIAIDTFLFSRIGMPLFHRYQVFDRQGSHPAFRGTYMSKLFDFLKETDAESIRRSHQRRAKEIAASMSQGVSASKKDQTQRTVQCTSAPRIRGQEQVPTVQTVAEMCQKTARSAGHQRSVEEDTVQALMDLALPRLKKPDDGATSKTKPWPVALSPPASPTSVNVGNRTRSPSPCVDLNALSSDDSEVDVTPQDFKVTLLYNSDASCTPVGSIVFSSEEEPPLSPGGDDRRKVRKCNIQPSGRSELMDRPANEPVRVEKSVDKTNDSLMDKPPVDELPEWSDSDLMPLITMKDSPVVDMMDMTGCQLPKCSEVLSPRSPVMVSFEDQDVLSAPLSPNHVQEGRSQDMPAEGSIFDVSPDLPGFSMRPAGVGLQLPDSTQPPPSTYGSFNDPFFGAPIVFAQCHKMPGLDTPMTLPIYNLPKEANIFPDQSVPTVLASGVSPDSIPWSTAEDIIRDISREGPFDASATPMDMEDSPLISTGLPGCPYRMTSYTGTALSDADETYGLQLHHPQFLEFIGAPESARLLNHSPSFWMNRLGEECAMAASVNL